MSMRALQVLGVLSAAIGAAILLCGCSSTTPFSTNAYDLQLALDPATSRIDGTATLHCAISPSAQHRTRNLTVDLDLHPQLEILAVTSRTARVQRVQALRSRADGEHPQPRTHRVALKDAPPEFDITVRYGGKLWQDVDAGEERGEIHNFTVSAHIGTNGIYLAGGNWYPTIHVDEDHPPHADLTHFDVQLTPVDGYTFVASASPVANAEPAGTLHFASKYPQAELAIAGGRYRSWERDDQGIRFAILLNPDGVDDATLERRADLFLSAAIQYMQRYVPLVGPYPYEQFTIVENFFSSGFAFPTFTLLGPAVIAMEDRSLRHGYLDHELLHSWWGNGVYVDPAGGNWCEALTSFAANLHGYVLDGDEPGARKARRDACNAITRIPADEDKPLATFGLDHGAGRTVGYQKGSMVFQMLARTLGEEVFWEAMRQLTAQYTGRYAGWPELRQVCEQASGRDLSAFFAQWVDGAGAPAFTLDRAWWDPQREHFGVDIRQASTDFKVDVPLRCHFVEERVTDVVASAQGHLTSWSSPSYHGPQVIELDPEYQLVRKLSGDEILPTISGALRGDRALIVPPPDGTLAEGYQTLIDDIRKKRKPDTTEINANPTPAQLMQTVIVVGTGMRHLYVHNLLCRAQCPLECSEHHFRILGGEVYSEPGQAALCCLRHPDVPGATITVYYGNSPEALSNAGILWFYGNSLLVFGSPASPPAGPPPVILRQDFEHTQRIPVSDVSAPSN